MRRLTEWMAAAGLIAPQDEVAVRAFRADSRQIEAGDVFVVMHGTAHDGSVYVRDAVSKGAVALLAQQPIDGAGLPVIIVDDVRLAYAKLCAVMYAPQPQHVVAVTGTNGKTSTAEFYRQLWVLADTPAASIGTLGLTLGDGTQASDWSSSNTSPAPDILHQALQYLAQNHIQHVALEASSHGLVQRRLDGVRIAAAAFTNLTQDHLDYHKNMEAYFEAKARLFSDFDAIRIINADDAYGQRLLKRHKDALSFGENGEWITLKRYQPSEKGLRFTLSHAGKLSDIGVELFGAFQLWNIMAALGLALQTGMRWEQAVHLIPMLKGVRGRMEKVAMHPTGAPIFIDYAHTPDALKHLLQSLRAHCSKKLHLVFGCGGDRDTSKRAPMGSIAAQYADRVIVTDDNPRSEEPELIRRQILSACAGAVEVAGRAQAIRTVMQEVNAGDVVVVAGKGHETYQIIGDKTYEFNDAHQIKEALGAL